MDISELKKELTEKIMASNDIKLLLEVELFLIEKVNNTNFLNEPATTYEKVRVFTAEEQLKINLALQQVNNGEYISDEEVQIEIEKWFEEQEK